MKEIKFNLKDLIKKKDFLISAAAIIICIVALNKIKTDGNKKIYSLKSKIEEEIQKNELYTQIEGLNKKIEGYAPYRELSQSDRTLLLDKISSLAAEFDLRIDSISFAGEDSRGFYSFAPIKVALIGDYHDFGMFVSSVESSEQFLKVSNVKVEKVKNGHTQRFDLVINAVIVRD